jgi:hypothetical protein
MIIGYPFGISTVMNYLCMSVLLVMDAQCTYAGLSGGEHALTVKPGSFFILSSWFRFISPDISFGLKELAESNLIPLVPVARYFVTAKGSFRIFRGAVKVDRTCLDTGGDLFRV